VLIVDESALAKIVFTCPRILCAPGVDGFCNPITFVNLSNSALGTSAALFEDRTYFVPAVRVVVTATSLPSSLPVKAPLVLPLIV